MRFLYVMDPLETMLPDKDTTFAFMRAAQRAGHQNFHCLLRHLSLEDGKVFATAREAFVSDQPPYTRYGLEHELALDDVQAVLVRKDPPFDAAYLQATWLLDQARDQTFIMNDPRGIRDANEKLYSLWFSEWTPRTIVTTSASRIRAFTQAMGGKSVIKPLDGAGGRGVLLLTSDDINSGSIIDLLTVEGSRPVMVQEYLPAVRQGDKRVILLDGEPLGAILRVPRHDDLRANIHVGGQVVACELTEREQQLVTSVGPKLKAAGLYFVGLDVIGERLTEVNVTSPTGIQELGRLTGTTPEQRVIEWLEHKVNAFRRR